MYERERTEELRERVSFTILKGRPLHRHLEIGRKEMEKGTNVTTCYTLPNPCVSVRCSFSSLSV